MDINQQREAIKKLGRSPKWPKRVDKMTDARVTAIYIRAKSQQKL